MPEQLQCILDPHLEELFDEPLEEQRAMVLTADEAEIVLDPGKILDSFCGC